MLCRHDKKIYLILMNPLPNFPVAVMLLFDIIRNYSCVFCRKVGLSAGLVLRTWSAFEHSTVRPPTRPC